MIRTLILAAWRPRDDLRRPLRHRRSLQPPFVHDARSPTGAAWPGATFCAAHTKVPARSGKLLRPKAGKVLTAFLAATLGVANAPVPQGMVALTFDDLPVFGAFPSAAAGAAVTDRLLDGFKRHRWLVTGFVNELQLEAADKPLRAALLERWLDAGMDLGNHTFSHISLNTTPADAYIADIARDETVTARLLADRGRKERWFRYPYLESGQTRTSHDQVVEWLAGDGYTVAPVTMENSDWQFSAPYDEAVARGDAHDAARIRRRYLTFTGAIVAWYEKAGTALFGRQPRFVFLLHASRLNATSIDALAAILKHARLRVVPLAVAMDDPVYRTADDYIGPDGDEWLERWATTLHRDLPFDSIPKVPADIVARDARLEAGDDSHAAPVIIPSRPS